MLYRSKKKPRTSSLLYNIYFLYFVDTNGSREQSDGAWRMNGWTDQFCPSFVINVVGLLALSSSQVYPFFPFFTSLIFHPSLTAFASGVEESSLGR